jgi:hypothetical protein
MSFNILDEVQEVDGKSPPSLGKCFEYNHSKRNVFILRYTVLANTDKAQCTIGVKLHEHYHNGFLQPAFPKHIKGLANFSHPIRQAIIKLNMMKRLVMKSFLEMILSLMVMVALTFQLVIPNCMSQPLPSLRFSKSNPRP